MKKLLWLLSAVPLFGYTYYYSDQFSTINLTKWSQNGSIVASGQIAGLTASSTNGGSLISLVAVPDGTSQYEAKATLDIAANGGTFTVYLNASSDALSGPAASGSYYAAELQNPTCNAGACSATLVLYSRVNGVVTQLNSTTATFTLAPTPFTTSNTTATLRAVRAAGNIIGVYVNDVEYFWITDSNLTTGMPGVGGRAMA